jgi:hypothetical protein
MRPLLLLCVACKGTDPEPAPAPEPPAPATTTAAATTARVPSAAAAPREAAWLKTASRRVLDRARSAVDATPETQRRTIVSALDRMAGSGSDLRGLMAAGEIAESTMPIVAPAGSRGLYEGAMAVLEGMVERLADKAKAAGDAGAAVSELLGAIKTMKLPAPAPAEIERLQLTAAVERFVGSNLWDESQVR